MRKSLCLVMLLLALRAGAQVSMMPQVPPAGVILKAQLWNILLVSASDRPVNVTISLRLLDAQQNQPLLTGITKNITLTKGAKQLQMADVSPVRYEYLSANIDRSVNGFLPAGQYLACYSLHVEGGKEYNNREDCIPFTIEPVSPPMLNLPEDGAVLESRLPQFTWLPPAPVNLFSQLNYEMLLTEVHAGQSAPEAIQQNLPVLRLTKLRDNYAIYPSSAARLDTGRTYAWCVIAKNGEQFAAQTEVWAFRIAGKKNISGSSNAVYARLRRQLDGNILYTSRTVYIDYINETADSTVRYEVLALEDGNRAIHHGSLALQRGGNRLEVTIPAKAGLHNGASYLFRLLNSRGEYWQLKFVYQSEN
ncbi:hypothetical protein ACFOTA_02950 [Chitinophaga sp. GCM10012297]|uniref:DUF928 domain-containing protein n=1 Tax=Chitinophaga chungangae TaxID=2821488 RepID=A0ABS3YAH8_9BACT|nr:hypothetical protein [Chitinophaga chungangae]MBO9151149.1 hypothetical protein [Chitinophaga chungangae]